MRVRLQRNEGRGRRVMRTPRHLDPYAPELTLIWKAGWGIRHFRTPIGIFIRLEKGVVYRGGLRGWWWRPTLKQAVKKATTEAIANPITWPATAADEEVIW